MAAEKVWVFDACAVVAFLHGEPGAENALSLLKQSNSRSMIHAINLCEVYYDMLRRADQDRAHRLERNLREIGFEIRDELPSSLWRLAGELKVELRVSLADSFALALAIAENGTLVTTDHHELDAVVDANRCPILFIR